MWAIYHVDLYMLIQIQAYETFTKSKTIITPKNATVALFRNTKTYQGVLNYLWNNFAQIRTTAH